VDGEDVGQPAVGEHLDLDVAVRPAVVRDPEEDRPRLGPGDGLDPDVLTRRADRVVEEPGAHPGRRRRRLGVAVAEQHDGGPISPGDDGVGEREAFPEVDNRAGRPGAVEGGVDDRGVGGRRGQQHRMLAEQHDRHLLSRPELVRLRTSLGDSRFEATRADVGRLHARRAVEHDDRRAADADGPADPRPDQGQGEGQGREQLEEEQEAGPEALPGRVRLAIGDEGTPEHQGRHPDLRPAHLQEVEEQNRRDGEERQQPDRCEQAHRLIA